jgi:hypothetical protein
MTETQRVLKLLEEKKLTADEAAKLLDALGSAPNPLAGSDGDKAKFLKVRVTDKATGKLKVNVTLPLAIVRWGMQFVPDSAQMELNEHNISLDDITRALESGFQGKLVEVDDENDDEHVEVYVE